MTWHLIPKPLQDAQLELETTQWLWESTEEQLPLLVDSTIRRIADQFYPFYEDNEAAILQRERTEQGMQRISRATTLLRAWAIFEDAASWVARDLCEWVMISRKGAQRMEFFTIDGASAHDATASGNFSGQVWMQRLISEQQSRDIELLVVSFEAGGRTRPHIHLVDQILHITAGRGIVATSTERRFVGPGDVVLVPAGEWHWHGAAPDSAMTHISIKRYGTTDWTVDERDWGT